MFLVTPPANDILLEVRALTETDVRIVTRRHALLLATLVDMSIDDSDWSVDSIKLTSVIIRDSPEIQQEIVWRGTWIERDEVAKLHPGLLVKSATEVIIATRLVTTFGRLEAVVLDELRPYSQVVRSAAR